MKQDFTFISGGTLTPISQGLFLGFKMLGDVAVGLTDHAPSGVVGENMQVFAFYAHGSTPVFASCLANRIAIARTFWNWTYFYKLDDGGLPLTGLNRKGQRAPVFAVDGVLAGLCQKYLLKSEKG
jgi:hypothetical protein